MDPCNIHEIKDVLGRHGFHFSKAKGQNFLIQSWVPERIAREAGVEADCGVLEVGPGVGPLTDQLTRRAGKVLAVEVDTRLRPVLAETLGRRDNLEILFGDILKQDIPALVRDRFPNLRPKACANLPYYITSDILAALLEARCFESVTVMVQKEVAERICAAPGAADYGAFSVFCQYHAQPEILFDVPPSCFLPQPKVTSSVLHLKVRSEPPAEVTDEAFFFRVVRASFAQRRKTLVNGLGALGIPKAQLIAAVAACGLPENVRGETLSIPQFAALAARLAR
ncbi:MAG TPA: ribosomal RNA small subunit methyltransferase A [Candidatus Avoscillospira avicola]|uniref:Ribosomal RNA small subunit methyltransferase A n=1 Tax=Candidatus Avoscillospira avicola TaxID=2840706 RepID=A0A9D1DI48_9FIRM|nr:ribosomal RNA small subunit methyltransferase A [Candidatus Avoscillospira avicola]